MHSKIFIPIARFIPTRGGNTPPSSPASPAGPVHPHTRGKYTVSTRLPLPGTPVHPHTRGKYEKPGSVVCKRIGSSPHAGEILRAMPATGFWRRFIPTRGGNTCQKFIMAGRFIPTRGGNTLIISSFTTDSSVHPHTRGKYGCTDRRTRARNGSSPHAGEIPIHLKADVQSRFIPTRGGNTPRIFRAWNITPVHPHTRGKYWVKILRSPIRAGSSPHAGEIRILAAVVGKRFIPTRGGNTSRSCVGLPISAVHPHTRGKYPNA